MPGVPFTFATAVSNIPLLELDQCFATQVTIGTTQVGLGNTTSNLGGLTNIALVGGDIISTLVTGTFVPTDQSGAGIPLTVSRATYFQFGNWVWVLLTFTFGPTGDGSNVSIGLGSLPNCANVTGSSGMWNLYFGGASFLQGQMTPGTNKFSIYSAAGSQQHNVGFSNATLGMQFFYSTI